MPKEISSRVLSAPTPADLHLVRYFPQDYVALLGSINGNEELPAGISISAETRKQMMSQADRLSEIMADKRPRDETKAVMVLLSSFPRQAGNDSAADILYEAYSMACEEMPTWAIEEAARRWISGKCGAQHWAPSPPELRVAAEAVVTIAKGKGAALRRLAAVRVETKPTEIEKARIAAEIQKVLSHADVGDKKTPTTAQGAAA